MFHNTYDCSGSFDREVRLRQKYYDSIGRIVNKDKEWDLPIDVLLKRYPSITNIHRSLGILRGLATKMLLSDDTRQELLAMVKRYPRRITFQMKDLYYDLVCMVRLEFLPKLADGRFFTEHGIVKS